MKLLTTCEPANALQFVPNPANSVVQLQATMPLAANATIVISNLYGQPLKTLPLNEYGTTTLHTATLANGIYYCRLLQNGNTTAIQKLVILH